MIRQSEGVEPIIKFMQEYDRTILQCSVCPWSRTVSAGTRYFMLMEYCRKHQAFHAQREARPFYMLQAESMFYSTLPAGDIRGLKSRDQFRHYMREVMDEATG